ncbi:saccharopine dehydrogenase NADP-binding domain-containing protein [Mycobacterium sp. 852002-40037_SCH5390672]|uniref:saccharopine dehydrogenase NADP-binding domain-containing protein n=1 Tax=Mycobacterium sp. 852002-40037_SCH5390672 TaxID=1834089 RepID=UPI0008053747|nr:saccharopine dehydrogenase NADP-binding domain-containing protein [Mycobacterium sp. 852002-40037_SCH5390672]OBB96487.1 hypothetical protein A5782_04950 [Mycobacterium sp. 852002-40037_SCH5390672]
MKIAIYGAYGYQGRLVVAELARRDLDLILVGRDRDRLDLITARLPDAEARVADATDHDSLVRAFRGAYAVINCAGPFTPQGAAVANAAIAAGCHYTDTSGEQLHIKHIYDTCAADAERAGVVVTPAMTDSGVPGDLLARVLADHLGGGPLLEVLSGHRITGSAGISRGSMRSLFGTVDVLKTGGLAYENGSWCADVRPRLATMAFPGDDPSPVTRFALQEPISVPRHVQVAHVQGFVESELAQRFSGTIPDDAIRDMPEGPSDGGRRDQRWAIVVEVATVDGRRARASAQGPDTYGTTAVIAAVGTLQMAAAPGCRAPAETLPAADFLNGLAANGITWKIDD